MEPQRTGLLGVVALVAVALLTTACEIGGPSRKNISLSPDGTILADWYMNDTSYVQLRNRGERFRYGYGTVLEADGYPLEMNWKSNTELEIVYPRFYGVYRMESRWNNVSITYREDQEVENRSRSKDISETYHFRGADSPHGAMFAGWQQDERRGDERWWEDCVKLYWQVQRDTWTDAGCSFVGTSGDNLKIKWTGPRSFTISYPPGTKISKAETKANDVSITYAEDPKLQKY